MALTSWTDVTAGKPVHHHCYMRMEWSTDEKHWTDISRQSPDLVAWSPEDALAWVRDQIEAHRGEAEEAYGRREWIEEALASYTPNPAPLTADNLDRWSYLTNTLRQGNWKVSTFHLAFRKNLVLWFLPHEDGACRDHERPADQPYRAPGEVVEVA
ncbi:hypothetical protein FHR84_003673 [Actinopolyspora biskrensis]|uniref:Uncharacterized protein n=1 Tax=Actinopolyspora biskrensis TaxID=1470178 RepID=A0A852Z9U9_9ACTN|nr:hypothetical protein [Actinopolyspora biskrensis]NYH80316.1 hypothetical protein [Actinopolyspora biskrensis]